MPGVTYLRLDGSVPATQRYAVVQRFNKDPSIDVLLLTTQVGGLGLNLTGADTVKNLVHKMYQFVIFCIIVFHILCARSFLLSMIGTP